MYQDYSFCPRCSQTINSERKADVVVVCDCCGFVISNGENKTAEQSQRSLMRVGFAILILLVAVFAQISVWDNHAIEVIPLKLKELASLSTPADIERMAQICLERKRYACAEQNYFRLAKRDPKQLLRLGQLQMSHLQYQEAVATYQKFFVNGGRDVEGSFAYAQALTQIGQIDEASRYYQSIMHSKVDAITQAAALHGYEKLQITRARMAAASVLPHNSATQAYGHTTARGIASIPQ